uniref:uncharacterized protein LOC122581785 n=1 Tax=Erigeron canadensis TaxID=72917 RepID=UPI001CB9117B|nr:uncharacterized protein LOC122581785 [Erigeron canadensis]
MEHNKKEEVSSVYCDQIPRLSANYPWFVVQDMDDNMDVHIFSTLQNPLYKYQCRIPDLIGRRIWRCFHGWLILSNHPHNNVWSLYNPSTSNVISLPPLILKDGDYQSISECCLSAPLDDPNSVFLLTRVNKPTFVFCQISRRIKKSLRKKPRWTEMSYSNQLKKFTLDGELLYSLTCCNGKVYALNSDSVMSEVFIQVDIVVKDSEVLIKLLFFGTNPSLSFFRCKHWIHFLKGSGSELFYIAVGFLDENKKTPDDVLLFRLDLTRINWEEMEGLKYWDMTGLTYDDLDNFGIDDFQYLQIAKSMWDKVQDLKVANFFVNLGRDNSISYSPAIASEFGGFVHIRDKIDNVIYSYNVNNQTIILCPLSSPLLPTSHMMLWECSLQGDNEEAKSIVDIKKEEDAIAVKSVTDDPIGIDDSGLLCVPLDILAALMEFCVGVEYMTFRATCKRCHLAAPVRQWSDKTALSRLQNYSLLSPWLMAMQMLGDEYYMKNSQISVNNETIYCSRFGWLVFEISDLHIAFFNPFTNDLRELPNLRFRFESLCFSAPPTSPDCMVVGFNTIITWSVFIHFVAREPTWRKFHLGPDPLSLCFPTLFGRGLYALSTNRDLVIFNNVGEEDIAWKIFEAKAPTSSCRSPVQYYLVKCAEHLLLVIVGGIGEPIEIFKPNDSTQEWEKVDGIGKHMIYICDTTCLCIEAKTREMENKIYLPKLSSTNGKIVFYSLETCTFHTFNGNNVQEEVRGVSNVAHLSAHAWVEPSWLC